MGPVRRKPRDRASSIPEKELQQIVMDLLKLTGWKGYHTWNSMHSAAGFPDVIATKDTRILAAELKREGAQLTALQQDWLTRLEKGGLEVYVWRPSDWLAGRIEAVLMGRKEA